MAGDESGSGAGRGGCGRNGRLRVGALLGANLVEGAVRGLHFELEQFGAVGEVERADDGSECAPVLEDVVEVIGAVGSQARWLPPGPRARRRCRVRPRA